MHSADYISENFPRKKIRQMLKTKAVKAHCKQMQFSKNPWIGSMNSFLGKKVFMQTTVEKHLIPKIVRVVFLQDFDNKIKYV